MNPHFASLVFGLAGQAHAALDGTLPPGTEQAGVPARELARTMIDTLAMLEEKTRDRLEPEEAKLLTEAITALRFRFVRTGSGR
jgi:hypothetical protein